MTSILKVNEINTSDNASSISIKHDGTTAITIDSSQNVGIGTSTPGRQFEISSTNTYLSLKSTDTSNGTSQIFFGDTSDDNVGRINYQHGNNAMLFLTSASERMRITSTGFVGIGTTTPSERLEVAGNVKATAFEGDGSALTGVGTTISNDANNRIITADGSGGLNAEANLNFDGTNLTVIGNVGIGTSSPTQKLEIVGSLGTTYSNTTLPTAGAGHAFVIDNTDTSTSSNSNILFRGADTGGTLRHAGAISWGKSGAWTGGGGNYPGYLAFYTRPDSGDTTERMRIDSSGNVGINTSSPSTKLEVDGKVTADNVNPNILTVAVGKFNSDGTTSKASGISCSRTATGSYSISFSTARPDANYTVIGQVIESSATLDDVIIQVMDGTQATTGFDVKIHEGDNSTTAGVLVDRNFYIVIYDVV